MEYLSVTEYAKKVNKDAGNIRRMLISGRIKGNKVGKNWIIPSDTEYPEDARVTSGDYRNWRKKTIISHNHPEISRSITKMSGQIADIYGDILDRVVLYGSYARGEEVDDSDIDIALFLNKEVPESISEKMLDIVVDFELSINKTISVITIEKDNYSKWRKVLPFYQNVEREGITLWNK